VQKNLIIINGQNYFPHDLERILHEREETGPGKVAVTAIQKDNGTEEPGIFILYKKNLTGFPEVMNRARPCSWKNLASPSALSYR